MKKIKTFFLWISILILLAGCIVLLALDINVLNKGKISSVRDGDGRTANITIYKGSLPQGVFIAGDFGRDQTYLKSIVAELVGCGAYVATIDYTGHGEATGSITCQAAAESGFSGQVEAAVDQLKEAASVEDDSIVLIGHGFGGREILRFAADSQRGFAGVAMVAPQINLDKNVNSPYFSNIDDEDMAWIQGLNTSSISVPVLIVGTADDDIVTPLSVTRLYGKLTGDTISSTGGAFTADKGNVSLRVLSKGYHPYQMYSNDVIKEIKFWMDRTLDMRGISDDTYFPMIRSVTWMAMAGALFLLVLCGYSLSVDRYLDIAYSRVAIQITNPAGFLGIKLALWLAAIPVIALMWGIARNLSPSDDISYLCMIGGYGLLALILYIIGRMPFAKGWLRYKGGGKVYPLRLLGALMAAAAFLAAIWFIGQTGLASLLAARSRIGWMITFTIIASIAYYIFYYEGMLMHQAQAGWYYKLGHWMIWLLPFLLFAGFHWISGAYTAFAGVFVFLYLFLITLLIGGMLRMVSGSIMFGVVSGAILLNLMTVSSAVFLK